MIGAVVAAVALAGLVAWAIAASRDGEDGSGILGLFSRQAPVLEAPEGDEGSSAGEGVEETRTPGSPEPARAGEQVPDETVYELVDVLSNAGVPPVMGGELTVEYGERLDIVRLSGRFTGTEETTLTLEYRDGEWRLKE